MPLIELLAPLSGWVTPLPQVPDPVFSQGLSGDGIAIDPVSECLHAPCDGVVTLLSGGRHAVVLKTPHANVLLHVGIDTVKLHGAGFALRVKDGQEVARGEPLLDFDLDAIVRAAPSAITPVLLMPGSSVMAIHKAPAGRIRVGERLLVLQGVAAAPAAALAADQVSLQRRYRVNFDHGLHARPAAQVAAAVSAWQAQVQFHARGRSADARSTLALMTLGVERGQVIEARATGRDADSALQALDTILAVVADESEQTPSSRVEPATEALPCGAALHGIIAARGSAAGTAFRLRAEELTMPSTGQGAEAESTRLRDAISVVERHLQSADALDHHGSGIFSAHLSLLRDPQLAGRALALLQESAQTAQAAWRGALREAARALADLDDPRMAERRADIQDLERQVLRVLAGRTPDERPMLPENAIVVAEELLPSQLLSLDRARLAGVCTVAGGPTAHAAILAAAMGVPMLVSMGPRLRAVADGAALILNADSGVLWVDPCPGQQQEFKAGLEQRALIEQHDAADALLPARTRDGLTIHCLSNLGAAAEVPAALAAGAEGCGLLRTEFLFLGRRTAPGEDEQWRCYQSIAAQLGERPLVIRTLDAGGDKPIAYLPQPREDNPALGLRGLRSSFDQPDLLDAQLRAIARVTPPGSARVLLPMVTDLEELRWVKRRLADVSSALHVAPPLLGVMIETPASALLADQLAPEVDFFSVGSNDLSQYALAMDRLHPTLAGRLDALHPAVLRLIQMTARAAQQHDVELAVCGALASDPEAVPVLIGLGVRELSIVPSMLPRIKGLVRRLGREQCRAQAEEALQMTTASAVRERARALLRRVDAQSGAA